MSNLIELTIEEYLERPIPITELNEYGTYTPRHSVVVVDDKKLKLKVYVVNNGDGFVFGVSYEYSSGGGGWYPSKENIPIKDKSKGLALMLDDLKGYSTLEKYAQYIDKAKKKLMVKQLTIFDL